ncbi:DUF2164 family protein [Aquibacillus kalidii]|uniref:DUF2164 family protein n=1 Tax=Aquibacillus kalidii TaxID=2762597 RepID=UPI00164431EB|nr:DUF2164 family protein [Aquibacillus kalidii]
MKQDFNLHSTKKQELIYEIQQFYITEYQEEIGNIKASIILEFFMDKLAPTFYNLGIDDAHSYLSDKLEDIFEIQKKLD